MKSTVVTLLLVALAVDVMGYLPLSEKFIKIVLECRLKYYISEDEINALKQLIVPEYAEGKCFLGCVLAGLEVLKDGHVSREKAVERVKEKFHNREVLKKNLQLLDKCLNEVEPSDDNCVTGPKLMECVKTHAPEFGVELP